MEELGEAEARSKKSTSSSQQRVALCRGQLTLLPLKVNDLIPVKFTPIADRDTKTATIVKQVSQEREGERERERERGRERESLSTPSPVLC